MQNLIKNSYKLDFFTEYHQFYLMDKKASTLNSPNNIFWNKESVVDRIALESDFLAVGTECWGPVKGEIILLDSENTHFDTNKYDHIVEGGIEVKSGELNIISCPTSSIELVVKMQPGPYKVRIYSSNLKSVLEFKGDENYAAGDKGDDYYLIEIWPSSDHNKKVIKRYTYNSK